MVHSRVYFFTLYELPQIRFKFIWHKKIQQKSHQGYATILVGLSLIFPQRRFYLTEKPGDFSRLLTRGGNYFSDSPTKYDIESEQ